MEYKKIACLAILAIFLLPIVSAEDLTYNKTYNKRTALEKAGTELDNARDQSWCSQAIMHTVYAIAYILVAIYDVFEENSEKLSQIEKNTNKTIWDKNESHFLYNSDKIRSLWRNNGVWIMGTVTISLQQKHPSIYHFELREQ